MNKYKMITICSLTIVCILILSLLLPLTTSANDKESLELNLHYENSKVDVSIVVNSEVYTGVICKYIAVDNILLYDDLAEQTKENGTALNLNKLENDKYSTTIENVSNRYIVVYVSIGNCNICDYIDCNATTSEQTSNNTGDSAAQENGVQENETQENGAQSTEPQANEPQENETQSSEPQANEAQSSEPQANEAQSSEPQENEAQVNEPQTNESQANESQVNEPQADEAQVNDSQSNESQATQTTTSSQNKAQETSTNAQSTTTTKNNQIDINNLDKDSINTDDFEEIESIDKTTSTSTADSNMPQTGENDAAKIVGIVVFSIVAMLSYYKYKTTK